jgi:hypothetical protein
MGPHPHAWLDWLTALAIVLQSRRTGAAAGVPRPAGVTTAGGRLEVARFFRHAILLQNHGIVGRHRRPETDQACRARVRSALEQPQAAPLPNASNVRIVNVSRMCGML